MGNIQRVEKEMNAIDPMLISQADLGTANGGGESVEVKEDPFDEEVQGPDDAMDSSAITEQNIE